MYLSCFGSVEQLADGTVGVDPGDGLREQRRHGQELHLVESLLLAERDGIQQHQLADGGLLDALMLIRQGLTSGEALDMCIVNKSFDSYERGLIRDCVLARIPDDLTKEVVFRG